MIFKRFLPLLLSVISVNAIAYNDNSNSYLTTQLTTTDGLSQNDVEDIIQDSYGYIWCATVDGLCRYDGYEFLNYTIGDRGLDANIIYAIREDSEGDLWVGTSGGGLYYYLRSENRFYHHSELASGNEWIGNASVVKYIAISEDGSIWLYNTNSREMINFTFDKEEMTIDNIYVYDTFTKIDNLFVTNLQTIGNDLYVGTSQGLYHYSAQSGEFDFASEYLNGYINSIERKGDKLFVGYTYNIRSLDLKSGNVTTFNYSGFLNNMCWVDDNIWISDRSGLFTMSYDAASHKFGEPEIVSKYTDQIARSMMVDNSGNIWVGYRQMGLCRYEYTKQSIIRHEGLGNNHIYPLYVTPDDKLLIGTFGSGLFVSDVTSPYRNPQNLFKGEIIHSIEYTPYNGKYYVATNKDVFELDKIDASKRRSIMTITSGVGQIISDDNFIWISTYGQGLYRYDVATGEMVAVKAKNGLPSNVVRNQLLDSRGNLWVCTDRGVALIDADKRLSANPTARIIQYEKTRKHLIVTIIEDHDGNIWYGTNGRGACRLTQNRDGRSYSVKIFDNKSGLPDNVIKSIICSKSGELWLSTKMGICSIDPTSEVIKSFDIEKEHQGYEFNEQSAIELSSGVLLFGGVNGITQVTPQNLDLDMSAPRPVITDLKIYNESILETDEYTNMIPSLMEPQRGITLKHNQNKISFILSALDFTNSNRYRYRYLLKGFDREKVEVSAKQREVVYTNIRPGHYTFIVEVSNGEGKWSESILEMPIRIKAPFWATWYSILIYIIVIASGVIVVMQYYRRRVNRKNAIKLAKAEQRSMREMMEIRTRFFTNISHEFRTPLTLILSPLQQIMADEELSKHPKLKSPLSVMYNNGSSLMRLISELLNFTKQESGDLKVELLYNNFTKSSNKIIEQFRYWTDQKGLLLEYEIPNSPIKFYYDKHLMEQIINNLLSNAIKHTPTGGKVRYTLEDKGDEILFSVSDTGAGIDESIGTHLFKRYYSLNATNNSEVGGTGIGLALSKSLVELHKGKIWYTSSRGEGATFYVTIPKLQLSDNLENSESSDSTMTLEESENLQMDAELQTADTASELESNSKPLMLVIDDNNDMLNLLSSLFQKHYNVATAIDGQDGIDKALELIPDIIISDVMMPNVTGLELCDRLKHDQNTSHIPIILLTAKTQERDVVEGYRTQADAYCTKPFSNAVLIESVNSILENRRRVANRIINHHRDETCEDKAAASNSPALPIEENITTQIDKEFLTKLTEFIEQNINNSELAVSDVCEKMGVTQLILNKKLKSLLNITANALIRSIRIKHAAALLRTGRYTVADVTYDVGFSDLRYFRECFKKEFGDSPQAYKDKFTKEETE
ncbi:MAG: ATP-binding protein [Rikenellaceae bacterium]